MTTSTVQACPACGTKNRVPSAARGRPRCSNCKTDLPWIVDATDDDYDEVVGQSPLPVLVDCWADWCGPCRTVSPLVEQAGIERAGALKIVKVDVDANQKVAYRLKVQGIPALFVVRDGEIIDRQVGAVPKQALDAFLVRALA